MCGFFLLSLYLDLNRVHSTASSTPSGVKVRSRLLIFSLCPDQSSSYVSMMNGIFSTQKQSIPVDSCVLADMDSLFLQQASHLTKGIYSRVPTNNQHALLQYLMVRNYHTIRVSHNKSTQIEGISYITSLSDLLSVFCSLCISLIRPLAIISSSRLKLKSIIARPAFVTNKSSIWRLCVQCASRSFVGQRPNVRYVGQDLPYSIQPQQISPTDQ